MFAKSDGHTEPEERLQASSKQQRVEGLRKKAVLGRMVLQKSRGQRLQEDSRAVWHLNIYYSAHLCVALEVPVSGSRVSSFNTHACIRAFIAMLLHTFWVRFTV